MREIYPRLRVFVSSKMEELAPERKMIKQALDALRVDAWVYEEDQGARPESIQQSYLEEVEAADLYLGVFWRGYGDATNEEYAHAKKLGKDCLIYEKRSDLLDRDPRLQSFLDRVGDIETGHALRWFETSEELGEYAKEDIARWQTRKIRERRPFPVKFSATVAEARQRNELLTLLGLVKSYWVDGVLKKSVHSEALIELDREEWPLEQRLHRERTFEFPEGQFDGTPSVDQPIGELFTEAGRSLLILGAPGSGKTTTLLQLARDLIECAERDELQPIPVVVNLSSWSEERMPLLDWLVEELSSNYRVPRKVGRSWLEERWLLPMLDGLDEVRGEHRSECVAAVNAFAEDTGVPGLVVCSRVEEYTNLAERLRIGGAVCLQPLKLDHVREYVKNAGPQLEGLCIALQRDEMLQGLAETPLMLSIMSIAYLDVDADRLAEQTGSPEERREGIIGLYVDSMFQRSQSGERPFSRDQVMASLSWLAKEMQEHSQSVFFLEGLQPSWLGSKTQRALYGVIVASLVSITFLIPLAIGSGLASDPSDTYVVVAGALSLSFVFVPSIVLGCWSKSTWKNVLFAGLICCAISVLVFWFFLTPDLGSERLLRWFGVAWSVGLMGALLAGIGVGSLSSIASVESLRWQWRQGLRVARSGALWGVLIGVITSLLQSISFQRGEMREFLLYAATGALGLGMASAIVGGVVGGMTVVMAEKFSPNEGIRLSWRNARTGFLVGFLIPQPFILWAIPFEGLEILSVAMSSGLMVGILVGLKRGGSAVMKHYSLRTVLSLKGSLPLRLVPFLDYSAKLILLKKVGGGYIFIHRMLLEYFARINGGARRGG